MPIVRVRRALAWRLRSLRVSPDALPLRWCERRHEDEKLLQDERARPYGAFVFAVDLDHGHVVAVGANDHIGCHGVSFRVGGNAKTASGEADGLDLPSVILQWG